MPPCWTTSSHHGLLAGHPVAGPVLVRVLAVAQRSGPLEGQVDGRRQERRGLEVGDQGPALGGQGGVLALVEPLDDGGVVPGGVGERLPGQAAAGVDRERPVGTELVEDGAVVGGVDHHRDVVVVLGRGPDHGRPAHVDQLDRRVGRERVEVADDQVDEADAQPVERVEVLGLGAVGQDAAVDHRVEGLDPAPEHLGRAGELGHLGVVDAGRGSAPPRCRRSRPAPSRGRRARRPTRRSRSCRRRTAVPSFGDLPW